MARPPKSYDGLDDVPQEFEELIGYFKDTLPNSVSVWDNRGKKTT